MTSPSELTAKPEAKKPTDASERRDNPQERDDHASVEAVNAFESGATVPKNRGDVSRVLPDGQKLLGQISTDQTTPVAKPAPDRKSMEAAADAINYACNGGFGIGCDNKTINATLENKSAEERKMITDIWNTKYGTKLGYTLDEQLNKKLSGSNLDTTMALLKRPDGPDNAGTIKVALSEGHEWFGRSSSELNKVVRNTLETMSKEDIAKTDAEYQKRYGMSLRDAIMKDDKLTDETKAAIDVYLKGADQRTTQESMDLAKQAAQKGNLDMFEEAMRRAPKEVKDYFASPEGQQLLKDKFGGWFSGSNLEHATDYAKFGKLSVQSQVSDNTSWMGDNEKAIEQSLKNMNDSERQAYMLGKKLANNETVDPNLTEDQKKSARDYYDKTSTALKSAAGQWFSADSQKNEMDKWEDMIANKDGGLISRLANHRGTLWNDNTQDVIADIENMPKEDWDKLKSDPEQRNRIEAVLKTYLGEDDLKRAMAVVDGKKGADSFENSQQDRRSVLDAIEDNRHWYNDDENKIYDSLTKMTDRERDLYKRGSDPSSTDAEAKKFASDLDKKLRDTLSDSEQKVAFGLLDKVKNGEKPEMSVIDKMNVQGTEFFGDKAQTIRDIQAAFDKDPNLQKRIANPQTDEDRKFAEQFKDAARRAMGWDYDKYAKPLIETGQLSAELRLSLNKGFFNDDEQGAYKDIQHVSAEEKQRILTDKNYQDKVLGFLSDDERKVALNSLQQGELKPEDKLRSYQLGAGTSEDEIKQTLAELNDRTQLQKEGKSEAEIDQIVHDRIQHMRDEYARKYSADLSADLVSELSGRDLNTALRQVNGRDTRSEFLYNMNEASVTRSGFGAGFVDKAWDGTGFQVDDQVNQMAAAMVNNPEKVRDYSTKLQEAIELHQSSKEALADAVVDTTIAVVAVGTSWATGGASLSLLGLTSMGAAMAGLKVGTKALIMGGDYDTSQAGFDAATGFADGFTSMLVLGAGKTAAQSVLSQAGKTALRDGSEQVLKEGTEALIKQGLTAGVKDEAIMQLASQISKTGQEQAVAALLKQSIGDAIEKESRNVLKRLIMQVPQNALSGVVGGGASGTIRAAHDAHDLNEFAKIAGTSMLFGGIGGTVAPFVLEPGAMVVGKGWNKLSKAFSQEASNLEGAAVKPFINGEHPKVSEHTTPVVSESNPLADVRAPRDEKVGTPETYVRTSSDTTIPKTETVEPYKINEYKPQPGKSDVVARPEAVSQSNSYKETGELRGKLEDGFQVVGGETRVNSDGSFHDPNRPAIVLDRTQDKVLQDTIAEAHARFDQFRNDPKRLAEELSKFSKEKMQPPGWINKEIDDAEAMFRGQNGNKKILLGDYINRAKLGEGAGACEPQALLMKVLGDDFNLDVSLSKGYYGKVPPGGLPPGYNPNHAFTELHLKDQTLVFDPRNEISGTPIDRLPHLTPAKDFVPGQATTPETFELKAGDTVAHDSINWKVSDDAPATPGNLVLRRDGQVSLTANEVAAANPNKQVKVGAELEINVNGKKEGGWIMQGTNADGTIKLSKADAAKIEVSPKQLAGENPQLARTLGHDNHILSGGNDLKPVEPQLKAIETKLKATGLSDADQAEVLNAIREQLKVTKPEELQKLAASLAAANDLPQRAPLIRDLAQLAKEHPDVELTLALRPEIQVRDVAAYTEVARGLDSVGKVQADVQDALQGHIENALDAYSRLAKAPSDQIKGLRNNAENLRDAIKGFVANNNVQPGIAVEATRLLGLGADNNVRIAFKTILDKDAKLPAVHMYSELTHQSLSIDIPGSGSGGHRAEFNAFPKLRELAAENQLGDYVFVAAAHGSTADSIGVDGAFLNVKTNKWVPVDFALNPDTVAKKIREGVGDWAMALESNAMRQTDGSFRPVVFEGARLKQEVEQFMARPSVPKMDIANLEPPYGTGTLPMPEFRKVYTSHEASTLRTDDAKRVTPGVTRGNVNTTYDTVNRLKNLSNSDVAALPPNERNFWDQTREHSGHGVDQYGLPKHGRAYKSAANRETEQKLAADLFPSIGHAVDARFDNSSRPIVGVPGDDPKKGRYVSFTRNSSTVSKVDEIRVYENGNIVGLGPIDSRGNAIEYELGSLKSNMTRANFLKHSTIDPKLTGELAANTPNQFDFFGKNINEIFKDYPAVEALGDAVQNGTKVKQAATSGLAKANLVNTIDQAAKTEPAIASLSREQRVFLAQDILKAEKELSYMPSPTDLLAARKLRTENKLSNWREAFAVHDIMQNLNISDVSQALEIRQLMSSAPKLTLQAANDLHEAIVLVFDNKVEPSIRKYLANRYGDKPGADIFTDMIAFHKVFEYSRLNTNKHTPAVMGEITDNAFKISSNPDYGVPAAIKEKENPTPPSKNKKNNKR